VSVDGLFDKARRSMLKVLNNVVELLQNTEMAEEAEIVGNSFEKAEVDHSKAIVPQICVNCGAVLILGANSCEFCGTVYN